MLQLATGLGVVFGLVSDGQVLRLLREVQSLPLKSVSVVVCLMDVTPDGARYALQQQGMEGMVAPTKKLMGMVSCVVSKVQALHALVAPNGWALELCQVDWSQDMGPDLDRFLAPRGPDPQGCRAGGRERDGLRAGDRVELHSLQAKPRYNGKSGTLGAFNAESGRWEVTLDGGGGLQVKAVNLTKEEVLEGGGGVGGGGGSGGGGGASARYCGATYTPLTLTPTLTLTLTL